MELPEDAIHEILLRVPAKPLCRLRAVCRSWRSLTTNPSFIAAHTARHGPLVAAIKWIPYLDACRRSVHLLDTSGHVVREIRLKDGQQDNYGAVVLTNLDVLCLLVGPDTSFWEEKRLCVLDPARSSTGAMSVLPHYFCPVKDAPVDHDNDYTTFAVGRGSSTTGLTKVLGMTPGGRSCKVLTLGGSGAAGSAQWRHTGCPPVPVQTLPSCVALVKGVLYFLACGENRIAAYDVGEEEWRPDLLRLPVPVTRDEAGLVELRDSLVAFYNLDNSGSGKKINDSLMDLWFLTDCKKVVLWSKKYTISMTGLGCLSPCDSIHGQPLWMLDDGRIVLWVWKCSWDDDWETNVNVELFLRVYDTRTNTCTYGVEMPDYDMMGLYNGSLLKSSVDQ